jgi:hypothetical protein
MIRSDSKVFSIAEMTPEVISVPRPILMKFVETSVPRRAEASPFLKWAGGKKQLLPELNKYVPENYRKYIEPFIGAGALFFSLRPQDAILGDLNEELINAYKVVRGDLVV